METSFPTLTGMPLGFSYTVEPDIIELANKVAPDFRYLRSAQLYSPRTPRALESRFPASIEGTFSINKPILDNVGHVNHPEMWVAFPQLGYALFMQLANLGQIPGAPAVTSEMLAAMRKGGAVIKRVEDISFNGPITPELFRGTIEMTYFRPHVTEESIEALCKARYTLHNGQREAFIAEEVTFGTHWPLR